eukprot:CAMPEP_0183784868 /NCGR_PEP_ID=MMETSP0739-20130205/66213_1 /TAXON_ID=385413 /ORGANISM="Thalassiosira miniscula, Strain CCMP1093" /LENGTH=392 /DNA_ID=CAMNT_0026028859 /DNA_START=69 /DNA_END=1247 /DNA_ORIENTATION=-
MPPQNIGNANECHQQYHTSEDSPDSIPNEYFAVKWFSEWEGYSCVARQTIEKHTLVHTEEPFLKGSEISDTLDLHKNGQHKSEMDDKEYLKSICGKSEEDIGNLWQLHDQYTNQYKDNTQDKRLFGIIMSNAFENQDKKRLYLTTSRFNHSCKPNCGYDFDNWTIRIYTLRKIEAGETMCISYSDVIYFFPREKRRLYLLGSLNFDCACSACYGSNDLSDIKKSDENRARLKQIAIELKHRVDASLYNTEFCLQVNETVKRMSVTQTETIKDDVGAPTPSERHAQLVERARLRKLSKSIPVGQHDIDLIVEYIGLLEKEKVDFDLMPVYKLAYEVSLKVGMSDPPTQYWADKYLELISCAKGATNNQTITSVENMSQGNLTHVASPVHDSET